MTEKSKRPAFGSQFSASNLVDVFLNSGKRPSEILSSVLEARTIGGVTFLTKREKATRDRDRTRRRKSDPQAAARRRATFRQNKSRIKMGRKKFQRSPAGKRLAKARGLARRRGITAWLDRHVPGTINLSENKLYLMPFREAQALAENILESPSLRKLTISYLEDLEKFAEEYVDIIADSPVEEKELQDTYEDVVDFIQARAEKVRDIEAELEDDED